MLDQTIQDPNSISMVMGHNNQVTNEEESKQPESILQEIANVEWSIINSQFNLLCQCKEFLRRSQKFFELSDHAREWLNSVING